MEWVGANYDKIFTLTCYGPQVKHFEEIDCEKEQVIQSAMISAARQGNVNTTT